MRLRTKDNNTKTRDLIFVIDSILVLGLIAVNILTLVLRLGKGEFQFQDFHARWQECAYILHGISPFDVLLGGNVIQDIGTIDQDMVTVPWAWIWSIIINPGYLKYPIAVVYGIVIYIITPILTSLVCYNFCIKEGMPRKWSLIIAISLVAQYSWVWSFLCGNHGAIACCLVIMAVMLYKEHWLLSGMLLTIAMIKPQVALPFLFVFLVLRQYKIIITTAVSEIITILILYVITGNTIWELLSSSAGVGTNLDGVYFGLFNLLKYQGINTSVILILDMIVGVLFTVIVMLRMYPLRGKLFSTHWKDDCGIEVFMGASVASTFWFYKQSHDFVILALPVIIIIFSMYKEECITRKRGYILLQTIFVTIFYVQAILRKILVKVFPTLTDNFSKELLTNVSCIILIVMTIIYVELFRNESNESN